MANDPRTPDPADDPGPRRPACSVDPPGTTTYFVYDADGRFLSSGQGRRPEPPGPEDPPDEPHVVG